MSETKINSSLSSKFKKTQVNSVQKLPDITGHTLGEFYADSRLDIVSGEADIYLCSGTGNLSGKKFLLKYYRRENAVKHDVLEKLKTVNSPFVATVESFGNYLGHQYVIRPYYEMSALSELLAEGTRFSEEELKTLIIPSIIEGLKVVHDAGILHKDLKPANLIPDDSGEHIVIIDFGISSDAGKNTFVVTQTGMTPFYAAPEAMQGIFHKETDYYALGITVFELFTGFTPFQNPELTPEETARLASVSKIEFPDNFPDDLRKLVLGLTYKDISHRNEKDNPNRRWGYDEVRRWLNGEDVPVPGESAAPGQQQKFLPYSFGGEKHQTLESLVKAMLKDPAAGIRDAGRGILTHHFSLFAPDLERICREAEENIQKNTDAAASYQVFYRLMYQLSPELKTIFCDGREFANLTELGNAAIAAASSGNTVFASSLRLLQTSFLDFYAEAIIKSDKARDFLQKAALQISQQKCSDTQVAWILGYVFSDRKNIRIGDNSFDDPAELLEYLKKLDKMKAMPKVGEYVKFGSYPQNGSAEEPIEWLVLEVNDNDAVLVSRYGLDCKTYNEKCGDITWEDCDLREWLNNYFLKVAFSAKDQSRIKLSDVVNDDNPEYGTHGGNNTQDWVFCLNLVEAERYFKNNRERRCLPTPQAKAHGAFSCDDGYCWWWLRSPGLYQNYAAGVYTGGAISPRGGIVHDVICVVRPALRLIWNL